MKANITFNLGEVTITVEPTERLEFELWQYLMEQIQSRGSLLRAVVRGKGIVIKKGRNL